MDSIDVVIEVEDIDPNSYPIQTKLTNIPRLLGVNRFSLNPENGMSNSVLTVLGTPSDTLLLDEVICSNENLLLDASPYGENIIWDDGTLGPLRTIETTGTYSATISDGCEPSYIYYEIGFAPEATINFENDIEEIRLGEMLALRPFIRNESDSLNILWTDPLEETTLDCIDCPNPIAFPLENVTYSLEINNESCKDSTGITVIVDNTRRVYLPNVFSPNADGINDYFYAQSPDFGTILSFKISNRWGGIVFESSESEMNQPLTGWNGKMRNEALNAGVYIYKLKIEFLDKKVEEFFGTVTIMR